MPKFFLHARWDEQVLLDTKGIILADLAAAIQEINDRGKWLQNDLFLLRDSTILYFEVKDKEGKLLAEISLKNVL